MRSMAAAQSSSRIQRDMQQEERLIQAVRKRRPLWDNSTPMHKNVRVLVYCWQQVADELGLNELVIKKKWKGLRDYFFRQVREIERNGKSVITNDNDAKYCLWPLFDRLTFLMENKKNSQFNVYKMTDEDRKMLEEITEYDKRQRNDLETIIYHVPSSPPEELMPEDSSTPTPNILLDNEPEQETTDQSKQSQLPPVEIIKLTTNTVQETCIIQPETTNKVTLCEPPPLRVFKHAPNISNKTDSLLTKILAEKSQPPPTKKLKPTPWYEKRVYKKLLATCDTESDADLHFFKSLLPFMRELPLEDRLRVRNGIQDLILGELEALRTKDNWLGTTSQETSSAYEELITPDYEDAGFDHASQPIRHVTVKEELEDDHTLLCEVDSKNVTFGGDETIATTDEMIIT